MAQSESDSTSGPMAATATTVDNRKDELAGPGRLISSRWRPATLRTTPSRQDRGLFAVAPWTQRQMADVESATTD